jgi:hypothetical protein
MPAIERLPVDAVKLTHPPGQVWFGGLDGQVVMVGHQDIGKGAEAQIVTDTSSTGPVPALVIEKIASPGRSFDFDATI